MNTEFDVTRIKQLPKVEVVYSYVESNTAVIRTLIDSGVGGIVFAGTGPGSLSSDYQSIALGSIPVASRPVSCVPVVLAVGASSAVTKMTEWE